MPVRQRLCGGMLAWAVSFGYLLDPTGAEGRVVRAIWANGRLIWWAPAGATRQLQLLANGQPWNYNGIVDDKLSFEYSAFYSADSEEMRMANTAIIIDQNWVLADVLKAYARFYDFDFTESEFGRRSFKTANAGAFAIAAVELKAGDKARRGQKGSAHAYNINGHREEERRFVELADAVQAEAHTDAAIGEIIGCFRVGLQCEMIGKAIAQACGSCGRATWSSRGDRSGDRW
jgi:hypothetical protein